MSDTTAPNIEAYVDRAYQGMLSEIGDRLDTGHGPLWICFRVDPVSPMSTQSFKAANGFDGSRSREGGRVDFEIPIPSGITEPQLRDLLKAYLRAGWRFARWVRP